MAGAPKGNRNGAKGSMWANAIKRALARAGGSIDAGVDKVADKLVASAQNGDQWAINEIGNRLDGKPTEHLIADFTHRSVEELSDGDLADIAAGGSNRAAEAPQGPPEPPAVH